MEKAVFVHEEIGFGEGGWGYIVRILLRMRSFMVLDNLQPIVDDICISVIIVKIKRYFIWGVIVIGAVRNE
jgi:hypothetical protein